MPTLPSGTVTFLFTDIEGSTPLWESHPKAMKAALVQHDAILNSAIAEHSGQVFKLIGDAFEAAFADLFEQLVASGDDASDQGWKVSRQVGNQDLEEVFRLAEAFQVVLA